MSFHSLYMYLIKNKFKLKDDIRRKLLYTISRTELSQEQNYLKNRTISRTELSHEQNYLKNRTISRTILSQEQNYLKNRTISRIKLSQA